MKVSKNFFYIILLFVLEIGSVFANELADTWYFYKVSKNTILGGAPTFERERLIYRYSQTKLTLIDGKVIVDKVCIIPYETTTDTTTPLSYWKSPEIVDRYKKIFSEEKIPLENQFEVTQTSYDHKDYSCFKEDFTDLIETGDYFVFMSKPGYLIVFSKNLEKDRELSATYRGLNREVNLLGHSMLSNKGIVNKMNKECDFPADGTYDYDSYNKCDLTELGIYFSHVIDNINKEKMNIYQRDDYLFSFTRKQIKEFEFEICLNIEKNNKLIDRLPTYKEKILESAAFGQYYYIDENVENIWLMNYIGSIDTQSIEKWRHYKIDNTGHFKLLESISCKHRDRNGIVKCKND